MNFPGVPKLLLSASCASDASHTAVIDTIGFDRVLIGVHETTVAATNPFITLKIGAGDTTTAFTDIATGLGSAQAATATTVSQTYAIHVDTRNRPRYLLLTATPFTTKTLTSFAVGLNAEVSSSISDAFSPRSTNGV